MSLRKLSSENKPINFNNHDLACYHQTIDYTLLASTGI